MKGLCPECETIHAADEECPDEYCYQCRGTGIAQSGPPDAPGNHCSYCGGSGVPKASKDDDDDARYEAMRDREWERDQ